MLYRHTIFIFTFLSNHFMFSFVLYYILRNVGFKPYATEKKRDKLFYLQNSLIKGI